MRNTIFASNSCRVRSQITENSTLRFKKNVSCEDSGTLEDRRIEHIKCPKFVKRIISIFRTQVRDPVSSKGDYMAEEKDQENCLTKDNGTASQTLRDETERVIICMKRRLETELFSLVGPQRYRNFVKDFVRHWDITILAARDDYRFALQSRDALLKTIKGVAVTGPWDLRRGDKTLDRWSAMLSRCQVVLVLVTKAFLQDAILRMCCSGVVISKTKRLIPIHLEEMNQRDFSDLQFLTMLIGVNAHAQRADDVIGKLVPWLPKQMAIKRHLDEIDILLSQNNMSYLDCC